MKIRLLIVLLTFTFHLLPFHSIAQSWQWVNRIGSSGQYSGSDEDITGLQSDGFGNVYVTGRVMPYATFGSYQVPNSYNVDYQGFLARYDCDGNLKWVKTFGDNTSECFISGLALDASGNPYIVGSLYNGIHFGDTIVNPGNNFFVAKYDSSGKLKWVNFAHTIANPQASFTPGAGIVINSAGTVITTGFNTIAGTTWPGINLARGDFLVGFHPVSGNALWGTTMDTMPPSTYHLVPLDMKINTNDDIYMTGWFNDSVRLGPYLLASSEFGNHGFILKYNTNGFLIWAKQDYAISDLVAFLTMTVSGATMYIEGEALQGDTVLGYPVNSIGGDPQPSFILRMDTGANLQWGITQDSASINYSYPLPAMTTDNSGNLYFISGWATFLKWGTSYPGLNLLPANSSESYLLVLNPSGNVTSLTQFPCWSNGAASDGGEAIEITNSGDIYYAGAFSDKIWLPGFVGDTLYSSGGDNDLFVMKYGNICTTTTVDNIKSTPEINVYPNPAMDKVTFKAPKSDPNLQGEIYNVFGQLVQIFQLNTEVTIASTSGLARGVYLYRICREGSVLKTGKIVLQ